MIIVVVVLILGLLILRTNKAVSNSAIAGSIALNLYEYEVVLLYDDIVL